MNKIIKYIKKLRVFTTKLNKKKYNNEKIDNNLLFKNDYRTREIEIFTLKRTPSVYTNYDTIL